MAEKMPMKNGKPAFIGDGKGMKKGGMTKMKKSEMPSKMGKVKTAAPSRDGVAIKGKTRGKEVKMAYGGMTKKMRTGGSCK